MSWYQTIKTFERHGEKNGYRVVLVNPERTTKQCANCGVGTEKPPWVREHSCPSCGFTTDRDHNASLETHQRGLEKLGVVFEQSELGLRQSELMSVETGVTASRRRRDALLANTVVEAENSNPEVGSHTLTEATLVLLKTY
ncbi:zinc ribbon domain-containing protein [Haloquadratum walsbyi]|jgi:Transposase and inactivated derivatives|uniref:zinc ribbon domain-containing protein n=1 Tax=Haloquadratum walsbyi TaxID=293091 RepID=UPI000323617A|nr:zinc ribbon domain-containing protein [Haloquadratum walsbyi]